jgi:hypothetical protein
VYVKEMEREAGETGKGKEIHREKEKEREKERKRERDGWWGGRGAKRDREGREIACMCYMCTKRGN